MFTGLVETTGRIRSVEDLGAQKRFAIEIPFAAELVMGESVAVNGCCLTVAAMEGDLISFDVLEQSLKVTALGDFAEGRIVNLERAMALGDRLGGHLVQGHIDGVGEIRSLEKSGQDHRLEIAVPESILKYALDKGSITIDGISLTVAELLKDGVVSWITPHTFEVTHLAEAVNGQGVNLEADLMAKYVERLFPGKSSAE